MVGRNLQGNSVDNTVNVCSCVKVQTLLITTLASPQERIKLKKPQLTQPLADAFSFFLSLSHTTSVDRSVCV